MNPLFQPRRHRRAPVPQQSQFALEVVRQISDLRKALTALASDPGNPHSAAAEALKILNRES